MILSAIVGYSGKCFQTSVKGCFVKKEFKITLESFLNVEAMTLSTFLIMVVMVLSCSKKSYVATLNEEEAVSVLSDEVDFKNFKNAKVVSAQGDNQYKKYLNERFGSSCKQMNILNSLKGNESLKSKDSLDKNSPFDQSLVSSDVIFYSLEIQNPQDTVRQEVSIQLQNKNAEGFKVFKTLLSINSPQAGGELLQLPMTLPLKCTSTIDCEVLLKQEPQLLKGTLNTSGMQYLTKKKSLTPQVCQIQTTGQVVSQIFKGKFKVQNGPEVEAYETVETDFGPIYCDGKFVGQGESKTVSIHSLQVKNLPGVGIIAKVHPSNCGGALLAESRVIKINERVVEAVRFEQKKPALKI